MNSLLAGVDSREKGQFPISIGTSLAVESAGGVYPDRPVDPAPINDVREVWFNLRTLFRNLQGCLPTEIKDRVTHGHLIPALVEEMQIIESAIIKISSGTARAVFYVCDYSSLRTKFPKAALRVPTTPKQIMQHALEKATIQGVLDQGVSQDLRAFRMEIEGQHPPSFIVTHLPVDLLSRYSFAKLLLLESHTGAIKAPAQWNTKLTNGKELVNIPFGRFALQVFGDNGHQFAAAPRAVREKVLELAKEWNWTSVTTEAKIRESLRSLSHPADRAALLALL